MRFGLCLVDLLLLLITRSRIVPVHVRPVGANAISRLNHMNASSASKLSIIRQFFSPGNYSDAMILTIHCKHNASKP